MPRLFLAAWPHRSVRDALARLPVVDDPKVRAVAPANWHVTLRFVGDADIDDVADRVDAASLPPLPTLTFGPEVIRLDRRQIVIPVAGADELATTVRSATAGVGEVDPRPFVGHLTIARTRSPDPSSLEGSAFFSEQTVDEIALVSSELLPTGAVYTTERTWQLG